MPLFHRRRQEPEPRPVMPGLAEAAAAHGLRAVDGPVFEGSLLATIRTMSRVLHGYSPKEWGSGSVLTLPATVLKDELQGTIEGRQVTFANAWTPMETIEFTAASHPHGTSVVAVELSTLLTLRGIEPRGKYSAFAHFEVPTGNAQFDQAFRVSSIPIPGQTSEVVTPDVQQRILVRYDWALTVDGTTLACVGKEACESPEEVLRGIDQALAVVHALPASIAPDHVDHSFDDLLVRINQLDSVEDAIAFLGTITPEDRERLAHSQTPLSVFADVTTPEQITERFMSLDVDTRLQVMAMFDKATGQT